MREKLMDAIRQHVAAEYPKEACGVIIQTGFSQTFIPCRNIADNPEEMFTLSLKTGWAQGNWVTSL